ncbi:MAG: DHH family protein [Candidatus Woesebacteria bacterium GW2011_GWA1_37_7]|uniref:DHH family protein n=1 Tax=Candidatus Woesebacteria bacterium GW2011_GWA1_37_7 TaxID=1618545 RepID=A0A0G0JKJ0_9BACT|nr:MAG: DHH family protein [Candidatus Woesebacteria bacterium GW2011_GWA1_37_7]
MNYRESRSILEKVKKAKRILLNCHRGPDPDSIGSALAMKYVLEGMEKTVGVICPSEKLYENVSFLKDYKKIQKGIDFNKFNFLEYDLFITLDSSSWNMVSSDPNSSLPRIPLIVIDHHDTNKNFGKINLVDKNASSVGEILYLLIQDWSVNITKVIATALLTAIIGDTGIFKYPNTSEKTFDVAYQLVKKGADKNLIIANIYRNLDFNLIKFWGEALNRVKLDKKYGFIYSAVPYEVYKKLDKPENAKESSIDLFGQITKGTEFGFMAVETEKNKLSISLRSRTDFDSSQIATALGGGGHAAASGAKIEGLPFDEAVNKVLHVARKYAKEK